MAYKELCKHLPNELVECIFDFESNAKVNMNNVIKELNDYNEKVEEYESEQYYESLLEEWALLSYFKRMNPKREKKTCPYLLKHIR